MLVMTTNYSWLPNDPIGPLKWKGLGSYPMFCWGKLDKVPGSRPRLLVTL